MTAPIDLDCPTCKVTSGRYCVRTELRFTQDPSGRPQHDEVSVELVYHHAARVDVALRRLSARIDALIPVVKLERATVMICQSCSATVEIERVTCSKCTQTTCDKLRAELDEALERCRIAELRKLVTP